MSGALLTKLKKSPESKMLGELNPFIITDCRSEKGLKFVQCFLCRKALYGAGDFFVAELDRLCYDTRN